MTPWDLEDRGYLTSNLRRSSALRELARLRDRAAASIPHGFPPSDLHSAPLLGVPFNAGSNPSDLDHLDRGRRGLGFVSSTFHSPLARP